LRAIHRLLSANSVTICAALTRQTNVEHVAHLRRKFGDAAYA
jgi:hypothetical protein